MSNISVFKLYDGFDNASLTEAVGSTDNIAYTSPFDKNSISYFRWNFLEGEKEILPGLICLPTPGHTYGHQSVLILTENGTVCVAGDAVPTVRNINENLETGVSVDSSKVIESMDAIRIRADYIITGHEPNIK